MKILVTGGAGFIGSHLCEALLADGHEVSILDSMDSFYPPHLKWENLAAVSTSGPVDFQQVDLCDQEAVSRFVADDVPDAIIHLAARAGVRPSIENPTLYSRVNLLGTTVMLETCRRFGVKKFIFASSSSVYGACNRAPFSEADLELLPMSPYAATKIAGEKLAYAHSHLYGLEVCCLRFFTVHGPRQRPDLAIRKFVEHIDSGKPIQVFGDGSTARDYTYVSDVVSGVIGALKQKAKPWAIYNLGNSAPVTLNELIQTIEEVVGKKAIIERLPIQPGDVPLTYADISKAQRELGYSPTVSLRHGVEKFVWWHRERNLRRRLSPAFAHRHNYDELAHTG